MKGLIMELSEELAYEKKLLNRLREELETLPSGSISIKKINGKEYPYLTCKVTEEKGAAKFRQKLISRKDEIYGGKILRRKFIEKSVSSLQHSIPKLEGFLRAYKPFCPLEIYDSIPKAYLKFDIRTYLSEAEKRVVDWENDIQRTNSFYKEDLKHLTSCGVTVRSKSEAVIVEMLHASNLDFKYEKPLLLGPGQYYPDFTILRKFDHKIIYWEHFGMTGDEDYSRNMKAKLKTYEDFGIYPWDNLIVTTDSKDGRINLKHIRAIIDNMFGL